ncbi:hypothetical protein L3X38_037996 [Prunus dulcis]|uniref:O-fucosyltransferase family protein n=1 Tax=Prunus dulcis TaxID=3755 RepID=A0AAD4V4S1_PRUDU|nr:hypothetical protein L3X38_037996 [Prunus dulcis]
MSDKTAYILNATLLVLKLGHNLFWKDSSNFDEIFDVDWFISSLSKDVEIIKQLPTKGGIPMSPYSMRVPRKGNAKCYQNRLVPVLNKNIGKVLPSVRVSDPGLLLKPDEPNLIIMAKPAGGPSKRDQHAGMDED